METVNLTDGNIEGSDFRGSILTGAMLINTILTSVKFNKSSVLPMTNAEAESRGMKFIAPLEFSGVRTDLTEAFHFAL